jgi:3-methyladenine DNA glycosylase AlkD
MLHSPKARVKGASPPLRAARDAKRALARMARPAGNFDASRYFRGAGSLGFYNTGTDAMRVLVRSIDEAHRRIWSIDAAIAFADALVVDRYLEAKSVGIDVLARDHRVFTPRLLPVCKRWLAGNHSANWATTDAMCGVLIGPLLVQYPELTDRMRAWSRDRNMWVRARRLHADQEDLIQKAVGWALREAGKTDMPRLERYLRANGPAIPRTTLRYAIERFPPPRRKAILIGTRYGR